MNYWATSGLPAQDFLFGWYSGSLLGAIIVASVICFFRRGNSSPKPRFRLNAKDIPWLLALAAVTFFALTLSYWALERTLLLLVQPVFLVGDMFIPAAIGFFLFKERKTFSRRQLWSLSLGIIGVILIVVATI
jgi:drug/metabolite transporter (DMT)-like permease